MKVVEAVKQMIKSKKMTQTDVAERIGKNQASVAMYLKSGEGMKLENLMKLADVCGYAVVLEEKSGNGERFVIGDDEAVVAAAKNDPEKEKMKEMFRAFTEWYKENVQEA